MPSVSLYKTGALEVLHKFRGFGRDFQESMGHDLRGLRQMLFSAMRQVLAASVLQSLAAFSAAENCAAT